MDLLFFMEPLRLNREKGISLKVLILKELMKVYIQKKLHSIIIKFAPRSRSRCRRNPERLRVFYCVWKIGGANRGAFEKT